MRTLEFPKCKCCGGSLEPLWFIEKEIKTPSSGDIYYTGKYSLQGTTQGNGLTGGVPPVRFSM